MTSSGPDLRALVASVVKEMLGELVEDAVRDTVRAPGATASACATAPEAQVPGTQFVTERDPELRTDAVRITDDTDLDQFARHLLTLFENPKSRQDLRAGRLRFRLARASSPAPTGPVTRIERGAVTERQVKAAAETGGRIVLGRRAVLTPLGREKARALDVHIEKER